VAFLSHLFLSSLEHHVPIVVSLMHKDSMERSMTKRLLLSLSLLVLAPLALWVTSSPDVAAEETWVEGTHYEVISPPVRTANPDKIELALWSLLHFRASRRPVEEDHGRGR
jgi:hypothetical protein